jgi:hypothetical protein
VLYGPGNSRQPGNADVDGNWGVLNLAPAASPIRGPVTNGSLLGEAPGKTRLGTGKVKQHRRDALAWG